VYGGFDYSIRTGYTFGLYGTTGSGGWNRLNINSTSGDTTSLYHRGEMGLSLSIWGINLTSDAYYCYNNDSTQSFSWSNSIYTMVMRKVGVTIGTGVKIDNPATSSRTGSYNIYNLITYNIGSRAFLRVSTSYSKEKPGNSSSIEFSPSLTWMWRKLFLNLDVTLSKGWNSDGSSKTRRIMLKLTRPFKIL